MYMSSIILKLHGSSEGKLYGFVGFHSSDRQLHILKG